jgi:hypothetical protein
VGYSNPSRFSAAALRAAISGFFLCVGLFLNVPSYALDETKVDLRLSIGVDVVNAPGAGVVSGRYGGDWGAKIGFWENRDRVQSGAPDMLAGVDHVWTYSSWRAGLGLVWINKVNRLNGTYLDFDLSLAYDLSSQVSLEFRHFSHGGMFGIDRAAPNRGWNLIGIGFIF